MSKISKKFGEIEKNLSISCLQPKLSLRLNRKKKCLELTSKKKDTTFILKPQLKGFPNLPENEHTCMMIAEHLGVPVLPHCLHKTIDGSIAYIMRLKTKMKDRIVKQKTFYKILSKIDKYSGDLFEIGEKIGQISDIPGLDIQLFFEIILLSFLLGNSDIHFKSFSLYYDEKGNARLSPAHDIISSQILIPDTDDFAISMGGKNRNIRGTDFLAFSQQLKIPEKTYTRILLKLFKGKRIIGKLIKNSPLPIEEKIKLSDLINSRFKRLLD